MNYTFLVTNQKTGQAHILCTTDSDELATSVCAAIRSEAEASSGAPPPPISVVPGKPGAKGKKVVVLGVEDEYAGSLRAGDQFASAMAASAALGFKHNAVSLALASARATGDSSVIVRGVELQYLDTMGGREV
jgi:hypothetical protein